MTKPNENSYRFLLLDKDDDDGQDDGPYFCFYVSHPKHGDIPIYIRPPPGGLLWSRESCWQSYQMTSVSPSGSFCEALEILLGADEFRDWIRTDREISRKLSREELAEGAPYEDMEPHERYLILLILECGAESIPLPLEMKNAIMDLAN